MSTATDWEHLLKQPFSVGLLPNIESFLSFGPKIYAAFLLIITSPSGEYFLCLPLLGLHFPLFLYVLLQCCLYSYVCYRLFCRTVL